jgi:hypothetical protein
MKEQASLAFVRSKNVRGYTYYQLVRNDRVGGKHRQEVLEHLGHHDSLEAAILAEDRKVASDLASYERLIAFYLNEAEVVRRSAQRMYQSGYHEQGQEVGILKPYKKYSMKQILGQQYEEARRSGDSEEASDRLARSAAALVMLSFRYNQAKKIAAIYEKCASDCQARLDRLLMLMSEYPQPIRSSRTFELLRRKEAQTP